MKRLRSTAILALLTALVVFRPAPAVGELCAIDAVPAATILVPYFEVNLANKGKSKLEHTKVTLINAQAAPVIAHVILWTDQSVPTFNFDIFLTGFDEQEFDVDLLFTDGVLPIPSIPDDVGFDSSACTACDDSGCTNFSPADDFTLTDLRNAHTGRAVGFHDGQCLGRRLGGDVARGYITIDNVNQCSRLFPGDSGYFENGGTGVANNLNQLKATITTYSKKYLREVPAFHIEAGTSDGLSTPGNYTFYGRFNDYDASDNRECGLFAWGFPWERRNKFKTEVIVWRDSGVNQGPFDCDAGPDFEPLDTSQIFVFDDQEDPFEVTARPFPAETQVVEVGKGPLNNPHSSGWVFMSLADENSAANGPNGTDFVGHGYVIARQRFKSREGEAWAHPMAPTLCGEPVSEALRARARRANADQKGESGAAGNTRKKKKRLALDPLPRPDRGPR